MKFLILTTIVITIILLPTFATDKIVIKTTAKRSVAQVEKCSSLEDTIKSMGIVNSCSEARQLAEACATGDSKGAQIYFAARAVCLKEVGPLAKSDVLLLKNLDARCIKICKPAQDGTMCLAQLASCQLNAATFINDVILAGTFF